jgi:E3 ubiquitin-protein ligase BRE1
MAESLKRSAEGSAEAVAKKRKPLEDLSEDGPLTQEDVRYFQKEAIWRQMNTYKKKCALMSRDLHSFKQKYEANEAKLNVLDIWYEQIVSAIRLAAGGLLAGEHDKCNDSLLIRLPHTSDRDKLDDVLSKRRTHLLQLLSALVEQTGLKSIPLETRQLADKLVTLSAELSALKAENETISNIKSGLESSLEALREKLIEQTKTTDRHNSKTLSRVDPSLAQPDDESVKSDTPAPAVEIKDVQIIAEPSAADRQQIEDLQATIAELEVSNASLQLKLVEISIKHEKSVEQCQDLSARLASLSASDLSNSPIHQSVVSQNKKHSERIDELVKAQTALTLKLQELESAKSDVKKWADETLTTENENLKQHLARSEADLVRIRTARDELISKNSLLKAETENKRLVAELERLVQVQKESLEKMYGEKQAEASAEDVSKLQGLSSDDLIKKITMVNAEIKEIELVFQQTHAISVKKLTNEVENDSVMKKLTVEKAKADQKYFAAMRSKDALMSENRILKSQIAKSQELIAKLNEMEKNYLTKISVLQKAEADFKTIKDTSVHENFKIQERARATHAAREKAETDLKHARKAIEAKTALLEELELENIAVANKLSRSEAKVKELETLLKKYRTNNTSSLLQEDEKQLAALRSIAKCLVCTKNWKDTAITVCGHVFCSHCAQERLAARLRRCPSCNKGFSANDLLSIHL